MSAYIIIPIICSTILGFISIQPLPDGNIHFIFPTDLFVNLFSWIISAFVYMLRSLFDSFVSFVITFPDRFNVNFLGFIWILLCDLGKLLIHSCFVLLVILIIISCISGLLVYLKNKDKRKILLHILVKILISIIVGLILGSIIGIIIKPYFRELSWLEKFGIIACIIALLPVADGFIDGDGNIFFYK